MSLILWTSEMAQISLRKWSEFLLSDFSTKFEWGISEQKFWLFDDQLIRGLEIFKKSAKSRELMFSNSYDFKR